MEDFSARDGQYVAEPEPDDRAYPFRLSARDAARVGQLFLNGGRWATSRSFPLLRQGRYNGLLLNEAWSSGIPLYVVGAAARILGTGRRLRVWLWRPEHCLCSIKATGGGADCRYPAECKRHQNKSLHGTIAIDCCCSSMNRPALECHFAPSRNRPVLCRGITPP